MLMESMTRVLPPAEMTLVPCGHPVHGYTWTAESGVEWKVS